MYCTFWFADIRTLVENGISQNCQDGVCPNIEEFQQFFKYVHLALEKEQDENKVKAYKEFFSKKFRKTNSIKRYGSENYDKASGSKERRCNKATALSCQELVADFAFLSMSKVTSTWKLKGIHC